MTVEITSVTLEKGIVTIYCINCSEEHLQKIERQRDDGVEEEIEFLFDTREEKAFKSLRWYLMHQKICQGSKTYGEALHALVGRVLPAPSTKYRVWK